jgi:hypothetical protein
MDIIVSILQNLANSLSPIQFFWIVILIIATSTVISVGFFKLRNHFFPKPESELSLNISAIKNTLDTLVDNQSAAILDILKAVNSTHTESSERVDELFVQIHNVLDLREDLEQVKSDISKQLDDMKHQFTMHDAYEHQIYENQKAMLQVSLDLVNKVGGQLDLFADFMRTAVTDFKGDSKDIMKALGELSKDVALVERSLQSQLNTVNAVKLR